MEGIHIGTDQSGPAYWFFGTLLVVKASGADTDGRYCLVEQTGRRGVITPLHRQPSDAEAFYVLDGHLRFWDGAGHSIDAPPGAFVHVPAGQPHAFAVESSFARWLDLTTPGHEAFFYAAAEPAPRYELPPAGPPDMDKVMAAAAAHGVEILGPPPEEPFDEDDR